jgi:two-component system chemotaxis sensor kinase CheA
VNSEDHSYTEFLDDYFIESEEHLASIRRHLLVLEGLVGRNCPFAEAPEGPRIMGELLRALHSLKGLSAMAGVYEAEEIAHAMEDSLRAIEQSAAGPAESVMEALVGATSAIEQVVAARHEQRPTPGVQPILSRLATTETPGKLWRCQFRPSAELFARGVHVNSIRSRLEGIGEILSATPHIGEGGGITFEFIVSGNVNESQLPGWQLDGLTVVPEASSVKLEKVHNVMPAADAPSFVRVDMKRLDHLMTTVGNLVISRGRVDESLRRLATILPVSAWRELQEANLLLQRQLRDLREGVLHVRMVAVGQIFERMRFAVRGLDREGRKDILLEFTGRDTEIDKLLVERMMDPLLHMVRNAVSHGLESPEERFASGKSRESHLRLSASTEAETVVIELEDDGRGVDIEQVTKRAHAKGLIGPEETLDSFRVLQLLCSPGFSTCETADMESGRGVGMTVVKTTINSLGGTLAMETRQGKGTRFTIRLPLTLAIMQALIVYIDGQPFAVPRSAIAEVHRVETQTVTVRGKDEVIPWRDGFLPIVYLHRLFRMNWKSLESFHVIVSGSDSNAFGIVVDRIAGQREIVTRSVEDSLIRVPGIAGATELGDGRPVPILDVAAIVDAGRAGRGLV